MNPHLAFVAISLIVVSGSVAAPTNLTPGKGDELCSLSAVGAIVVQPDGKFLVDANGGWLHFLDQRTGVFGRIPGGVFRFGADGSVDHGFRSELRREANSTVFNRCLVLQPDGKLLASDQDGRVVRLTSNGNLDKTFALAQVAGTNAPLVWARAALLNRFALGPAGEVVVRAASTSWDTPPVGNGGSGFELPVPVVQWFDSTGRFLRWSRWAESKPPLAGCLTLAGMCACGAHSHIPYPGAQKDVYYEPLKSPLEDQLAEPAVSALLRRFAEDLPLSLCRYAVCLPDGGVVLALAEPTQVSRGRLLRFDREWRWDHSFLARFEWGHPAITMQLALDGRGGLLVIGALKSLNGRECTGLARLLPDGTTDSAFETRYLRESRQNPAGLQSPLAIAVQRDGRILVAGRFEDTKNRVIWFSLARLNPDGSADREFSERFSFERFEEAKRRLSVARLDLAARPKPAAVSNAGSASTAVQSQGESSAASQTIWLRQLEVAGGSAVIDYDGAPNAHYILQAKDAADAPVWSNIATNQADAAGRGQFKDASAGTAAARFYRVLSRR